MSKDDERLCKGLLSAFPDRADFDRFLRFRCEESLEQLAPSAGTATQYFEVLRALDARGLRVRLFWRAWFFKPGNPELTSAIREVFGVLPQVSDDALRELQAIVVGEAGVAEQIGALAEGFLRAHALSWSKLRMTGSFAGDQGTPHAEFLGALACVRIGGAVGLVAFVRTLGDALARETPGSAASMEIEGWMSKVGAVGTPRATTTVERTANVAPFRAGSVMPPSPDAPYDGSFYIHRGDEEARALAKLATPGTPIVISGPWLSGKTTLLAYLLEKIREQDTVEKKTSLVLEADLENLLPDPATPDGLLESFGRHLLAETGADDAVFERLAKGRQGWSDKLVELMEKHVLPACEGRLVLVIQNADAVWGLGKVQGAFYRALRVWKERAHRPAWSSLRFILLLSTTPSLVFEDPEHANSPFANLTTDIIELGDFAPAQLVDLGRMHGLDWAEEAINRHVFPLVGGHPHLSRALMYRARMLGGSLEALVSDAAAIEALFSTHLAALGGLMKRDRALQDALVAILDNPSASLDEDHYQRLRRAGLVAPTTDGGCRIRYRLYEAYLRRRWRRPAR
ncbi:MAG: AAA-like domain-containing protein [Byssovorax sp.]